MFWSPNECQEAEYLHDVVQCLDIERKLKRINAKEVAAAKKLFKKNESREAREAVAEVRRKHKAEERVQIDVRKAEAARLKEKRNTAKALQLSDKDKRKLSQAPAKNLWTRVKTGDINDAPPPAPPRSPPHMFTTRGRSVKLHAKFRSHIFFASDGLLRSHKILQ